MLDAVEIDKVIVKAAEAGLGSERVMRVQSRDMIDSQGREALGVTIVLKRGTFNKVKDSGVLHLLSQIQRQLHESGENRLPIVDFVTEEELDAIDDPES